MKPGYQTSEFWLQVIKQVAPFVSLILGTAVTSDDIVKCALLVLAALQGVYALIGHLAYLKARLTLKAGAAPSGPVTP